MNIKEWFFGWIKRHKNRNSHHGWRGYEESGFEVYLGWIKAFEKAQVTENEAEEASMQIQPIGDLWPIDHLPTLLKLIATNRQETKYQANEEKQNREKNSRAITDAIETEIRIAWQELADEDREKHREQVRQDFPNMKKFPLFIEKLARCKWAESVEFWQHTNMTTILRKQG